MTIHTTTFQAVDAQFAEKIWTARRGEAGGASAALVVNIERNFSTLRLAKVDDWTVSQGLANFLFALKGYELPPVFVI